MQQNRWRRGSAPDPAEGPRRSTDPIVGWESQAPPQTPPPRRRLPYVYINDQMLFTLLSHKSCFAVETLVTVYIV